MRDHAIAPATARNEPDAAHDDWQRRLGLLIRRLPLWMQPAVHRLRHPSARWVRVPAGLLLTLGGVFSILPLLGLWMLPLGLVLLAEDFAPLRRVTGRALAWVERHRPHWLGLQAGGLDPALEGQAPSTKPGS